MNIAQGFAPLCALNAEKRLLTTKMAIIAPSDLRQCRI